MLVAIAAVVTFVMVNAGREAATAAEGTPVHVG